MSCVLYSAREDLVVTRPVPQLGFKSSRKASQALLCTHNIKTKPGLAWLSFYIVRARGLEPPRIAPLVPKTNAATNYATRARSLLYGGEYSMDLGVWEGF